MPNRADFRNMLEALHPLLRRAYDPERFLALGEQIMKDLRQNTFKTASPVNGQGPCRGHPQPRRRCFGSSGWMLRRAWRHCSSWWRTAPMDLQDPRYMGHQVAVPFPDGALVGMVTDLFNNGGAVYEMGPTNSAMEEVLMSRLVNDGVARGCGGSHVHGGTLANLVALLAREKREGGPAGSHGRRVMTDMVPFWFRIKRTIVWIALCGSWGGETKESAWFRPNPSTRSRRGPGGAMAAMRHRARGLWRSLAVPAPRAQGPMTT